jgi:hypothetical protein
MAASVLNTSKAVEMSIFVVRAFVRLRELLSTHHQLTEYGLLLCQATRNL